MASDILGTLKKLTDKGYELTISREILCTNSLKLILTNYARRLRVCRIVNLEMFSLLDQNDILIIEITKMIDEMDHMSARFDDDFRDYSGLLD